MPRILALLLAAAISSGPVAACAQPPAQGARSENGVIDVGEGAMAFIPARRGAEALPVLVLLHGAGGDAVGMMAVFQATAEAHGVALLAPKSAGRTWDLILAAVAQRQQRGGPSTLRLSGGDSARVESALDRLTALARVDRGRVVLSGFSDGASYALSIGPLRPDLYRAIVAFSPGFSARPARAPGRQPVYVSHGRSDRILSFARAEEVVVPALRAAGHEVSFHPFAGGHTIPQDVIAAALRIAAAD